jgi:enamine deaminase RidA (YjgF/YER057c/UK114 family)
VSGDGGHIAAERDEVQYLLHIRKALRDLNAIYARYFPEDPPARIFVCVPEWTGPFDIEIDCVAVV